MVPSFLSHIKNLLHQSLLLSLNSIGLITQILVKQRPTSQLYIAINIPHALLQNHAENKHWFLRDRLVRTPRAENVIEC